MYVTKARLSKIFGMSPPTVYDRVRGIEKEIGRRYNEYAISDNLISVAVFADYNKYRKRLADKNMRDTVPPFDMARAETYIKEMKEVQSDKKQKIRTKPEEVQNTA